LTKLLLVLIALYPITISYAEMYKWVDEEGNINYGDSCPLPECESQAIEATPKPTDEQVRQSQERIKSLKRQTQRYEEMRKEKESQKRREREDKQKKLVETKKKCTRARQNLHILEQRRPAYSIDDKGKHVFIEDAARAKEIERLQQFIEKNCN